MHQKTQKLSRSRSLLFPKNLKKLKISLVPEAYISLTLKKLKNSLDPEKLKIPPHPEAKGERAVASEHVNNKTNNQKT